MSSGVAPAWGIYGMVIVSLLHMITAYGSIYLMVGVMIVSEGESRGWDGGEEEERGRTPRLLRQAINPHYKRAGRRYHVVPFITT